jgi:hypothetical protein
MRKVELSDRTMQRLFRRARSFDDDIETVVERALDELEGRTGSLPAPPRDDHEDLLPETAYWTPILELLKEAGGSARGSAVIDMLEDRLLSDFTESDLQPLKTGEVRWRNRARFARLRMKERGLIEPNSPRGIWEITDDGVDYLRRHERESG